MKLLPSDSLGWWILFWVVRSVIFLFASFAIVVAGLWVAYIAGFNVKNLPDWVGFVLWAFVFGILDWQISGRLAAHERRRFGVASRRRG